MVSSPWTACYTPATVQFTVPEWDGVAFVVGQLFVLTKGNSTARCVVQTHPLGLELRLSTGRELLQSQMCRGQDDVLNTFERWRAAMQEKGLALIAITRWRAPVPARTALLHGNQA